jgi:hypothetical protein
MISPWIIIGSGILADLLMMKISAHRPHGG